MHCLHKDVAANARQVDQVSASSMMEHRLQGKRDVLIPGLPLLSPCFTKMGIDQTECCICYSV